MMMTIPYTRLLSIIICLIFFSCNNVAEETHTVNDSNNGSTVIDVTIDFYNKCISEANEHQYLCHYDRGELYFREKEYSAAINDFKVSAAMPLNLEDAKITRGKSYWYIAIIHSKLGLQSNARDNYLKALEYNEDPMLYNNLGLVEIYLNEYDNALKHIDRSLELNPENSFALNNKGYVLLKMGQLDEAKLNLDKSEKLNFKNPHLLKNLALYYSLKKDDKMTHLYITKAKDFGFLEIADHFEKAEFELLY